MKTLITPLLLIFVLLSLASHAYALPDCTDEHEVWDGCTGTYTFTSGAKYVGEYKDGQMHGKGTFTFVDGSSYVGEHKDGNWHGKGTFTWANGTVESGIWTDGKYLYESVESARSDCAKEAGKAGTEYAAKQIEKTCLAEKQLEPES